MRALSAMPGVVNLQLSSGLVIRGASPQDSKILIDDFEVPVLFHDLGFRSIMPTDAIKNLSYSPGGFDVAYGRATSGIVALTTYAGTEQRSEQIDASSFDAGVIARGSAGTNTRYMIAFRRSALDLVGPRSPAFAGSLHFGPSLVSSDLASTTAPRYYDEQLRIDHTLSPQWRLKFSSIGSDDSLELSAANPDQRVLRRSRFIRATAAALYHDGPWSGSVAVSGIAQQFVLERGVVQHADVEQPNVTARAELMHLAKTAGGLTHVVWRAGAEAAIGRSKLDLAMPQELREGQPMGTDDPNDTRERFTGAIWTPDLATWTSVAANLDPKIRFTTGVRIDEFARNHDHAIQPRGELTWKLTPTVTAQLSAGAYARPPEFRSELLFANVHPERSTQTSAGLTYAHQGVRVQGALYYTDRTDLLTYAPDGVSLLNQGRGTSTGVELLATLRRGPWFGLASYAYSHSMRIDFPRAESRLFDYDQPHRLDVALSRRSGRWQFGGRFELSSGLPYTPVVASIFDSDTDLYKPIFGPVNSARTDVHHQLDLRIDRSWQWGRVLLSGFLDVQNVYSNGSAIAYLYSFDYSQRAALHALPILPTIGLRGVL